MLTLVMYMLSDQPRARCFVSLLPPVSWGQNIMMMKQGCDWLTLQSTPEKTEVGLIICKRVPYQGGKQMATDKEGEGAHEDCVIDSPNRGDCMGDDTSHDHHHQRQRSEHYVHRPVVPESGSQLHMQATLSAPTD